MSNQSNGGRQGRGGNDIGSWIFTVVMLWAFFPVGVILLIVKLREAFRKPAAPAARPMRRADGQWQPAQPIEQRQADGQWQPVQPVEQRRTPMQRRPQSEPEPVPRPAPPLRAESKKQNQTARRPAVSGSLWIYNAVGAGLIVLGVYNMLEPLEWLIHLGFDTYDLWNLLQWGAVAAGGIALLGVAGYKRRKEHQYAAYLAVIGDSQCLSLDFVASATGRKYAAVIDDLQDMIRAGYFGHESYLDLAERCFVACHAAAPRRDVKREETPGPVQAERPGRYDEEEQICRLNKTISNPHVTACMSRLEELTHKIFAYVEAHPEKESRIRRFRAHYLPKTIKICQSYARFEQQGVQGGNIRSAMQEVEEVMDSLVRGFENQLDMLFDDEALDVSTDISVLESMMAPAELKIEDFMPKKENAQ